jgi:hypothetical protein
MSSLQQSIERRRAAEPALLSCVDVSAQPTLVVALWQGKNWAFPWSSFQKASVEEHEGRDELAVAFTHEEIVATGENLQKIWPDITAFRVALLRNLPAEYRSRVGRDVPFITKLEIRKPNVTSEA